MKRKIFSLFIAIFSISILNLHMTGGKLNQANLLSANQNTTKENIENTNIENTKNSYLYNKNKEVIGIISKQTRENLTNYSISGNLAKLENDYMYTVWLKSEQKTQNTFLGELKINQEGLYILDSKGIPNKYASDEIIIKIENKTLNKESIDIASGYFPNI